MDLYPYQKKIVDQVLLNLKKENKQLIVVPTGGGKTVIFSHIIKRLNLKTLIVAHTRELISQCKNTLNKLNIKNATVKSIQKIGIEIKQNNLEHFDLLIIDECHRGGAKTYLKLINCLKASKIIGVTATPFRSDNINLKDIFGEKVSPLTLIDMIQNGLLSDFVGYRVKTNCSLAGVRKSKGDFQTSSLCSVINTKNRNEIIVKQYINLAKNEKCLCFAINIKHVEELNKEFQNNGISSASVHGDVAPSERKKIIENFKEGKIRVLVSCQILTEGFDEPSITCLLMARPTCSKVLYMQMIGRGSRLFPGKEHCKVIEFTDNEYDVTSIEDILDSPVKKYKIKHGESFKEYAKRTEKLLLEEGKKTVVEKMNLIPLSFYDKPATQWQIGYLRSLKIQFCEPLTEFNANQLISEYSNNITQGK